MKVIKTGAKSRGALSYALGSTEETIHSVNDHYSETLGSIAYKMVEENRAYALKVFQDGYAMIDGVATTSITQIWYGKYEKAPSFAHGLNDGQTKAYRRALSTTEDLFIEGMSGVGKTVTLIRIAQTMGLKCCIVAPTNAAVKRIADDLPEEHGLMLTTIHKALQYVVGEVTDDPEDVQDALELDFTRQDNSKSMLRPIVIMDEAGMVNKEMIDEIKRECSRVIFFGDLCQLEPVEGEQYDFSDVERIELTQQMRQDFTDTGLYKSIMSFKEQIKNETMQRGTLYCDDTLVEVESLARHFIEEGDIDVIGSYTNNVVIQTNEFIKEKLDGTREIETEDRLLLYAPLMNEGMESVKANGEIVEVSHISYNPYIGRKQYEFRGAIPQARSIFNTAKECYRYWEDNIKNDPNKKMGWRTFKKTSVIARPMYCRTIHKLQGSTFNIVGVNQHDIYGKAFEIDTYNRLMYVALSRAKKKAYIMT